VGFSAAPTVPTIGQPVTFTGTATDADDTITSVTWNLGDGASSAGTSTTASHAYATPGVKTVTMSATNSAGQTTTATGSVRVNAPPTARIVFSAVNARPGQALDVPLVGQQVAFAGTTSSDPEGPIAAYSWDLDGNGTFGDATGPGAVATYATAGEKAHPEAPVELLVVLDRFADRWAEKRRMDRILWRHSIRNDAVVTAAPVAQADFERAESPYLMAALDEGVRIA
jgi:PKD domain-containing protein